MTMHRSFIPVTVLALAMAAAMPAMAGQTVVVAGSKHNYVYYGDHEIYFRPETKTYFWRENERWQSGSVLPSASRSFVTNGGLTVELDTERPYEQHAAVVTRYATAHPRTGRKHDYVYYRDHEIYFRPETKTYFWRENDRWQSGSVLPRASRGFVGRGGLTVALDTERPYEQHDAVVTRYATANPRNNTTTERVVANNPDGSSTTTTTTTKHQYVYYGEHDIYFAPERKTYYWRAGGRWESGRTLPVASRAFVTRGGMPIELETEQPYTRHDYVVTKYKDLHDHD